MIGMMTALTRKQTAAAPVPLPDFSCLSSNHVRLCCFGAGALVRLELVSTLSLWVTAAYTVHVDFGMFLIVNICLSHRSETSFIYCILQGCFF